MIQIGSREIATGMLSDSEEKTMVFMGDAAQLRPVCGAAIYDKTDAVPDCKAKHTGRSFYSMRTARSQAVYEE